MPDPGVRIEVIRPERVGDRVAVQRASFDSSTFTEERWHAMAAGAPYADARCLVAYDERGAAVATVTVWSGPALATGAALVLIGGISVLAAVSMARSSA